MKKLIILFLTFGSLAVFAQSRIQAEKLLNSVNRFDQIDSLKRANHKWEIYGETLSSIDTINFPFLNNPIVGEIYRMTLENRNNQNYLVKLLKKEVQTLCRVQYIFLDGEKFNAQEIDSIRTEIHRRNQRGEKFSDLVEEYNMDGGTGDIGWFGAEMVVDEFYNPIVKQQKNEVFDVSIPQNNWFYVVKKTEDNVVRNYFYSLWIRYI